jgi:hypothetical protein
MSAAGQPTCKKTWHHTQKDVAPHKVAIAANTAEYKDLYRELIITTCCCQCTVHSSVNMASQNKEDKNQGMLSPQGTKTKPHAARTTTSHQSLSREKSEKEKSFFESKRDREKKTKLSQPFHTPNNGTECKNRQHHNFSSKKQ